MAENVKVRAETPMFGIAWGQEATLERTPAVEAAIEEGRLTVVDTGGKVLRGEALDDALREAGLSTAGTADAKRARLAQHQVQVSEVQVAGEANVVTAEEATVGTATTTATQPEG